MTTATRRTAIPLLVLACAVLAGPALAKDVLLFTNGKHLAVDSFEVVDGMIYVDIGHDEMAFPREQVEKIIRGEAGSREDGTGGNRMVAGTERSARRDTDTTTGRGPTIADTGLDPSLAGGVEEDDSGTRGYRPFARSSAANRRGLAVTGSHRVTGGPQVERASDAELKGVTRMGDRLVIGGTGPRRRPGEKPKPVAVPLEALPNGPIEGGLPVGTLAPPSDPPQGEAPSGDTGGDGQN